MEPINRNECSETLIAVVTCPKYKARIDSQLATWIPVAQCAGYHVEIFDGDRLGVSDDYLALPQKTQAICRFARNGKYKRLLKIDDDGYIRVDKLEIPTADYAGGGNEPNDYGWNGIPVQPSCLPGTHPHRYANGGAYWLSARGFIIMADADITDWAEDRWVGNTLGRLDIPLTELPGYKGVGPHELFRFLTHDSRVLMQLGTPEDMLACHRSAFDNVIRPKPKVIHKSVYVRSRRR